MTLTEAGIWASIVLAGGTLLTLGLSLWISIRSLKELKQDKRDRQRPVLLFEPIGERVFLDSEADTWPAAPYGALKNYGSGPALNASVSWHVENISIGKEKFPIDEVKRKEKRYLPHTNTILTIPGHLVPGDSARLGMFPPFIKSDRERHITSASGWVEIHCLDIFGQKHVTKQGFWLEPSYDQLRPYIHIAFMDVEKRGSGCTEEFCQGCSGTGAIRVKKSEIA